jgi:hypothetical protein
MRHAFDIRTPMGRGLLPVRMGTDNEHVAVEEDRHIVKLQAFCSVHYLGREGVSSILRE